MAILADLTRQPHRRLPPRAYIARQALDVTAVHGGSQKLARGLAGRDWPFGERGRVEAAIELVARTRPRVEQGHFTTEGTGPQKEHVFVGTDSVLEQLPKALSGPRRNREGFYKMRAGAEEGPLFNVTDRATGVVLGQCRGTPEHVRVEAERLAQSQGHNLGHVKIEVAT